MDTEKETITDTEDEEISVAVAEAEAEAAESEEAPSAEEETSKEETTEAKEEKAATPKEEKEEESFDAKVKRLAQSRSDKLMKPLKEENSQLKEERDDLRLQLNEKSYDSAISQLYGEESEKDSEEAANRKKADREKWKSAVLEYQKNRAYVERVKPELEARQSALEMVERDQMAYRDLWGLYFPEDKEKIAKVQAGVKEFAKDKDLDDYEETLERLKESHRKSQKTFKPDSSKPRMATSGKLTQEKIDAMSADEKIRRNDEIIAFYESLER